MSFFLTILLHDALPCRYVVFDQMSDVISEHTQAVRRLVEQTSQKRMPKGIRECISMY